MSIYILRFVINLDINYLFKKAYKILKPGGFRGGKTCPHNVQSIMKMYRFAFIYIVLNGDWTNPIISLLL